jgi:hypothetical protein
MIGLGRLVGAVFFPCNLFRITGQVSLINGALPANKNAANTAAE